MTSRIRFIAQIPLAFRTQETIWLLLEEDAEQSGGWFLYGHRDLDKPSEFDSWHPTQEEARREAERRWGVREEDWQTDI